MSVAKEITAARAKGVEVSAASVTVCYVLADLLDGIDDTGADKYLAPQLAARLLEERKAANLLPVRVETVDDVFAALTAGLGTPLDDASPG